MGREFELKYAATPAAIAAICADGEGWTTISMETTYFDTLHGTLKAEKCTLRQRMENDVSVCTLKTPADGFGRGEWAVEAPWCEETVVALFAAAGYESIPFEQLHPVCGARFTRLAMMVELSGCTVEVALDQGVLSGGGEEIPLCEVEVECKSGDEQKVIAWAQHLAENYGLQPERFSKFYRASRLGKGE